MFRVLTNKQVLTFKTDTGNYEIVIENKVDNKAHARVTEFDIYDTDKIVLNRYQQEKSIAEKEQGYFSIIEEFYPDLLKGKE